MPLLHPKTEPGYPPNCITVDDAVNAIREVFSNPRLRVERFNLECVTDEQGTLKLSFNRKKVGQPTLLEIEP